MIRGTWETSGDLTCTSYTTKILIGEDLIGFAGELRNLFSAAIFVAAFISPCFAESISYTIAEVNSSTHKGNCIKATALELVYNGIKGGHTTDVDNRLRNFEVIK